MSDNQAMFVRLPVELHRALKERAAKDDRTMAQAVRQAIRLYLNRPLPYDKVNPR